MVGCSNFIQTCSTDSSVPRTESSSALHYIRPEQYLCGVRLARTTRVPELCFTRLDLS